VKKCICWCLSIIEYIYIYIDRKVNSVLLVVKPDLYSLYLLLYLKRSFYFKP